jgi:hypothetical protein
MQITPHNDIEAIEHILEALFKDKMPNWHNEQMVGELFDESYSYESDRILRKIKKLDLITYHDDLNFLFQISDYAIEILNQHGSYLNFISSNIEANRKKDKEIIFDRLVKNGNIIAALLISAVSLILTQCPKDSAKRQEKIEQGLQSVATQLDSLKQVLRNNQTQLMSKSAQDTATSK